MTTRRRSQAARSSTIQTCCNRADALRQLQEWLDAYDGDTAIGKYERALAAAARAYFYPRTAK